MKFIIHHFVDVKVHNWVMEANVFPKILISRSIPQAKILLGVSEDKFGYI